MTEFLGSLVGLDVVFEAYEWRKGGTLRRVHTGEPLQENEELSFRNRVTYTGDIHFPRFIPCVDFLAGELSPDDLRYLGGAMFSMGAPMHLFHTGRSFHGYVPVVVTERAWVGFLGAMLILNRPNTPPVTDARWIGHKLKQGHASLRISANTKRHAQVPRYVRTVEPLAGVSDPQDDYQ